MLIEFAARLHTGRWTDTQAKAGVIPRSAGKCPEGTKGTAPVRCSPLLPAACRPLHLEEWDAHSLENLVRAVRQIRFAVCLCPLSALFCYLNLQSNYTKFLHFIPFCFFGGRTAVAYSSSIDRLQLVCFVKGNSLFPLTIPSAERNPLDHSRHSAVQPFPFFLIPSF